MAEDCRVADDSDEGQKRGRGKADTGCSTEMLVEPGSSAFVLGRARLERARVVG
jgi:hypothetical protein